MIEGHMAHGFNSPMCSGRLYIFQNVKLNNTHFFLTTSSQNKYQYILHSCTYYDQRYIHLTHLNTHLQKY